MNMLRKSLATVFVILAILSLVAMLFQGFQFLRLLMLIAWLATAAALSDVGSKPVRAMGYVTSAVMIGLSAIAMQVVLTLEPGSNDAFGAFMVASAGILLAGLSAWGIYSANETRQA